MSLSGDLRFVPLDEVLRLIGRVGQKGSIEVVGDDINGRIFVTKKGIALATIIADEDLHRQLINSDGVDDGYLQRIESGQADSGPLADQDTGLMALLREITVESIHQMGERGSFFEVEEGVETPYAAPKAFELEGVIEDVRKRWGEWAEIAQILPDLKGIIKISPDLGDRDEVTISRDAWKVLGELGSGSSVATIAARLGTTDFWTAKVAADMAAHDLLVIGGQAPHVEATEREGQSTMPVVEAPTETIEAQEDDPDPDEAPDEKGKRGKRSDEHATARLGVFAERRRKTAPDEPASEQQSKTPKQAAGEANARDDVEENAEVFLERVFSELDSDDSS